MPLLPSLWGVMMLLITSEMEKEPLTCPNDCNGFCKPVWGEPADCDRQQRGRLQIKGCLGFLWLFDLETIWTGGRSPSLHHQFCPGGRHFGLLLRNFYHQGIFYVRPEIAHDFFSPPFQSIIIIHVKHLKEKSSGNRPSQLRVGKHRTAPMD